MSGAKTREFFRITKQPKLTVGEQILSFSSPHPTCEVPDWPVKESLTVNEVLANAFSQPCDFPPLELAIVDGDSVALAVEPGVPQVDEVVVGVVRYLLEHDVLADDITVLLAHDHQNLVPTLEAKLEGITFGRSHISVRFHHGDDPETMGYLAAAHGAEPIYVDRSLLEADVVLPITCARDPHSWAYSGLYGVVPWFTDSMTQGRWRTDCATNCRDTKSRRLETAQEVGWLLGIQPVISILPGANGSIDSCYFGSVDGVERAIGEGLRSRSIPAQHEKYSLVVVSLDGDHDQQTWDNVGRVLHLADHFLENQGSVVVLSQLSTKPSPALRLLTQVDDSTATEHQLLKSHDPNALAAIEIVRSRQNNTVYFMSQLRRDWVEEMGMCAIESKREVEQLLSNHPSCLIISGAQHRWLEG